MGQLACCKDKKDKDEEVNEQVDIYNQNQNYGITYPIKQEQIFKTKPPCWFGHKCPCPCHNGTGPCIFKLKSK